MHTVRPQFRKDIVEGTYVKVHYLEAGLVRGRVAYKGDIKAENAAERIVTIYFPDTEDFYDLNMWGNDGKMIQKYEPPIEDQFEIPDDPVVEANKENRGEVGEEETEEAEEAEEAEEEEEEEEAEEAEEEEVAAPAPPRKRKKRKSLYTHKKKRKSTQ